MFRRALGPLTFALAACAAAPTSQPRVSTSEKMSAPVREAPEKMSAPVDAPLEASSVAPPADAPPPRFAEPIAPRAETRAIVLLYHSFGDAQDPKLKVKPSDLERHLEQLRAARVEIVTTSELLDFLDGKIDLPARVAVITIDDGFRSVYRSAWPILRARNARFTVGLVTGIIEDPKNAPVMTWDNVREMVDSGLCEVASHGHMHRALAAYSGRLMVEEIEGSRDLISQRVGRPPVAYFYPLGSFSGRASRELAKAGYRAAFRATGAPIAAGSGSRWWLPRMGVFQGDSPEMIARWFSPRFLGRVSYVADRDPANAPRG